MRSRTHNPTTTSPVSGSLIKLTGAGPSGQAKTSEPSPSCHDMMDLSSTGCQAATQVHCPVGVRQQTLGKHPVDLICIYPPSLHVKGSINIGSASSSSLSTCEWMYSIFTFYQWLTLCYIIYWHSLVPDLWSRLHRQRLCPFLS